ncbi:MAG TPA: hypothetical protein PLM53_20480 [Spirochaetota bacterium]|nr:hypothetical protein [Spirochaetota bacterium]HPC43188.1 hypothetical protein [Spirochaetota bacterium]HPL15475.1 hypothetical protein [Spirochaetota bacterium]HQF10489.1 hypothetical protein [Spirochaetota bacterium]HQH99473.1 hypothetical protein [Spirochaetota bacterium]
MKLIVRSGVIFILICFLCAGCSTALIKEPLAISNSRWQMTLEALRLGPDQYNNAGGYREPRKGRRFLWATLRIRNSLKTEQVFLLNRIMLTTGVKQVKPFIIDMNIPATVRANPEPRLASGETVSRRLIYIVPDGAVPEKITYEKTEIVVPVMK